MAAKRSSRKVLEWQCDCIGTTDATITNGRIDLGLRDDELAEIHRIDSHIGVGNIPDAANDEVSVYMMASMDPDVIADPSVAGSHEDLEVFFEHSQQMQQEVGAAGTAALNRGPTSKSANFDPPIIVATDLGQVVKGDAAVACEFWTRVYFTRRKGSPSEVGKILLKRR
jgi:hypothetical protein